MTARILTADDAKKLLGVVIKGECERRERDVYSKMRPQKGDTPEMLKARAVFVQHKLREWAADPIQFVTDCGWAPDHTRTFGADKVPPGMAPKGMVPLVPYPRQKEWMQELDRVITESGKFSLGMVKSRQWAATTYGLWIIGIHGWLFRPSYTAALLTFARELIDGGGKGNREANTLFGRMRLFLDAFIDRMPVLKFQQGKPIHTKSAANRARMRDWVENPTGLSDSNDVKGRLTRPKWIVGGEELFPEAEGNYIVGDLPSDSAGRSMTLTVILYDELGQYVEALGAGTDHDAWNAASANCKVRIGQGTIPKGGGIGTKLYQLTEEQEPSDYHRPFWGHWSDIAAYMAGARYKCKACGVMADYTPIQPGPGKEGIEKDCPACGSRQRVYWSNLTSPWYEKECALLGHDPIAIGRELDMDWGASRGDQLFSSWSPSEAVVETAITPKWIIVEGYDPGQTMNNPGCWVCAAVNPRDMQTHIIGYWMAVNPHAEFWIPFLARWSSKALQRHRIIYGRNAGKRFVDCFDYPPQALEVLDRMAKHPRGNVFGDKFGSHTAGGDSVYNIWHDYGIIVDWEYTKDREELVRQGVEWAVRMTMDPRIAEIKPPTPTNQLFPCVRDVFASAKPADYDKPASQKLDVHKKDPPYVNNAVDAWLYLCRFFDGIGLHATVSPDSEWGYDPLAPSECIDLADGFMS